MQLHLTLILLISTVLAGCSTQGRNFSFGESTISCADLDHPEEARIQKSIKECIARNAHKFGDYHKRYLNTFKSIKGPITRTICINSSGKVTSIKRNPNEEMSKPTRRLGNMLSAYFIQVRFPKTKEGACFTQAFEFERKDDYVPFDEVYTHSLSQKDFDKFDIKHYGKTMNKQQLKRQK